MRTLNQCEGCEYPLGEPDNLDAYNRGELEVNWFICQAHQPRLTTTNHEEDTADDFYG